jgi:hypothetical protein
MTEPDSMSELGPLRFSDVIQEIRMIANLAGADGPSRDGIVAACGRAESLLESLRTQFLHDVVIDRPLPAAP